MLGMFELEPHQNLQLTFLPPETRYWSVTLESIWHECLEPLLRSSSVTNKGVSPIPTDTSGSRSEPKTPAKVIGWTPVDVDAVSSSSAGWTTRMPRM